MTHSTQPRFKYNKGAFAAGVITLMLMVGWQFEKRQEMISAQQQEQASYGFDDSVQPDPRYENEIAPPGYVAPTAEELQQAKDGYASPTPAASSGDTGYSIGDRVVMRDRAITVTEHEYLDTLNALPGNQFSEDTKAKGKFLIVALQVENTGNETGNMAWSNFEVVDSQGRVYDEADWSVSHEAQSQFDVDSKSESLPPGMSMPTVLVFDIAPDAENPVLVWNDDAKISLN